MGANLQQGDGLAAVADLGGSILTGADGNPLAVLARQLRIPLHAINSEGVPLYCSDGKEANRRLDQQVLYCRLIAAIEAAACACDFNYFCCAC